MIISRENYHISNRDSPRPLLTCLQILTRTLYQHEVQVALLRRWAPDSERQTSLDRHLHDETELGSLCIYMQPGKRHNSTEFYGNYYNCTLESHTSLSIYLFFPAVSFSWSSEDDKQVKRYFANTTKPGMWVEHARKYKVIWKNL